MMLRCLAALAVTLIGTTTASAQGFLRPGEATPFVTLDRTSPRSTAGFETTISLTDDTSGVDSPAMRFDLYGQYMAPNGFGVYVNLPLVYASIDDDGLIGDDSAFTIGNIDLSAVYDVALGPGLNLTSRAGFIVATGPDDDFAGVIAMAANGFGRVTDVAQAFADITWARLATSPQLRSGQWLFRADIGFDIAIDEGDIFDGDDLGPIFRANAAVGFDSGAVIATAELANTANLGDDSDDEFIHTIALGARASTGGARPYGAIIIPLDDDVRDVIDLAIAVGVSGSF